MSFPEIRVPQVLFEFKVGVDGGVGVKSEGVGRGGELGGVEVACWLQEVAPVHRSTK